MKLTEQQRRELFAHLVTRLHADGALAVAVAELPTYTRAALRHESSAGDHAKTIAAMSNEDLDRLSCLMQMQHAVKPELRQGLVDRLDEAGFEKYFRMLLDGEDADDWLREAAAKSLLTPEQVEANKRTREKARIEGYRRNLRELVELGELKASSGTTKKPKPAA